MSVTFNRKSLIKAATAALAEHEKAKAKQRAEVEKFKRDHAADSTEDTRANARRLRDGLTALLKKQGPIAVGDVRRYTVVGTTDLRSMFYTPPDQYNITKAVPTTAGLLTSVQVTETRALLEVLNAGAGDIVSANELKLLGLKNLAPVFAAAAGEALR